MEQLALSPKSIQTLRVSDFDFYFAEKDELQDINNFIRKYEWLGEPSLYVTHRCVAKHKQTGVIAGVVTFDMPLTFSNLLGKDTRKLERLVSRGASASWTPKNLASAQIMWAIRYLVKTTDYRLFTAYSDPLAGELGTIYQACNFTYLGQKYGTNLKLFDLENPERGWFSDRALRSPSYYRKYAVELGIDWKRGQPIPQELRDTFNNMARQKLENLVKFYAPLKHKYAYILGRTKTETEELKKVFKERNKKLIDLPYPKVRGDWS